MSKTIKIGTRGSQLALWQANYVQRELSAAHPDVTFEQVIIKTTGDRDQKSSLAQIGGMGVFTKSIEDELLATHVDIAVHSLKDLPSAMSDGLILGAVPQRAPVNDVLVTLNGLALNELPKNACIATGSIRRRSQLLAVRPDLQITDLRGNIDTRLSKLQSEGLDGIIMAQAALVRLGLDKVRYAPLSLTEMVPAVGQGAIGVQIREHDRVVSEMVRTLDHIPTRQAVTAERALLHTLDSGCQFPVGAHAALTDSGLFGMTAFVGNMDGKTVLRESITGAPDKSQKLGVALAERLIEKGARDILEAFA